MKDFSNYLHYKFRYGSNNNKYLDCYTFAKKIREEVYKKKTPIKDSIEELERRDKEFREGKKELIKIDTLEEGCILLFSFKKPFITHIGIYIGGNKFIHLDPKQGVKIERYKRFYKKFTEGYYEYKS